MYTAGKLIYFNPFYFKSGSPCKPKYFLILKIIEGGNAVVACLPSSKIHLPADIELKHGCLEVAELGIGCYLFLANQPVTKDGWSFPATTLLYGNWLDDYGIELLKANYSIENVDYEIIGELIDEELQKIIACFTKSAVVKRKYKRVLGG